MKRIIFAFLTVLPLMCGAQTTDKDFVKGADVGFLAGQERQGVVFHDRNGRQRECLEMLKNDYQMSAIRLRVWVNPRGGDCDKFALLAMARRVKALGMDLMVDFHYSDWWADPAKQPIPKAWLGHSYEEMKQDLRNHTRRRWRRDADSWLASSVKPVMRRTGTAAACSTGSPSACLVAISSVPLTVRLLQR